MICSSCESPQITKLSLIFDSGTAHTSSTTTGTGVGFAGGRMGVGVGVGRTKATTMSTTAMRAAPPAKKSIRLWWLVVLIGFFTLGIHGVGFVLAIALMGLGGWRIVLRHVIQPHRMAATRSGLAATLSVQSVRRGDDAAARRDADSERHAGRDRCLRRCDRDSGHALVTRLMSSVRRRLENAPNAFGVALCLNLFFAGGDVAVAQSAVTDATISQIYAQVSHPTNTFQTAPGFRTVGAVVSVQRLLDDQNMTIGGKRGYPFVALVNQAIPRSYLATVLLRDPNDSSHTLACVVGVSMRDPELAGATFTSPNAPQLLNADTARKTQVLQALLPGQTVTVTGWDAQPDPFRQVAMYGCDIAAGGNVAKAPVSGTRAVSAMMREYADDFKAGNTIAFESANDGKTFLVSGRVARVRAVDSNFDGNLMTIVDMDTGVLEPQGSGALALAHCFFAPGETATGLTKGMLVTLKGRYSRHAMGFLDDMLFLDCTVQH